MFEMTGTIHWANDPCVRVPGLPYSRVFRLGTAFLWFRGHRIDLGTLGGSACRDCNSEAGGPNHYLPLIVNGVTAGGRTQKVIGKVPRSCIPVSLAHRKA